MTAVSQPSAARAAAPVPVTESGGPASAGSVDPIDSGALLRCLSLLLHEPQHTVQRALQEQALLQQQLATLRNRRLTARFLRQHLARFRFPQVQAYAELLAVDPRSRILVTYHCSDYVYALNVLANSVPHSGPLRVLSLRAANPEHWHNLHTAFGPMAPGQEAELQHDQTSVLELAAYLRTPGSTLVLFCDLPAGCGERTRVEFLQQPAWFPLGPALLAASNAVPMLPVMPVTLGEEIHLLLFPQIEPTRAPEESVCDCANRLTGQLVAILEQHLQRYPGQWRYLPQLPLYFAEPAPH